MRSVEEFDSAALVDAVETVVIKPDGIDVVMKCQRLQTDRIFVEDEVIRLLPSLGRVSGCDVSPPSPFDADSQICITFK